MTTKNRRKEGDETWFRLKEWTKGQKASERLSGHILRADGFKSIDPSHPLGGPDSLKDIASIKDSKKWISGCYFSRAPQKFNKIKDKFLNDFNGLIKHKADGFIFITNQEISVKEREKLLQLNSISNNTEIYHLERIVNLLNSPVCYGVRLEFLDIGLTKEEQLSYFAERDKSVFNLQAAIEEISKILLSADNQDSIPISKLQDFNSLLDNIIGDEFTRVFKGSPIQRLKVPIKEITDFQIVLGEIVGKDELHFYNQYAPISRLKVPLSELQEYEITLDRVLIKRKLLKE